jgi:hypothetical protein
LVAEGEKPNCIQKHLLRVYGDVTTVQQRERWIKEAETRGAAHYDKLQSGCTCTTLPRGTTLNADHCIETIRSLNACLCQVHPARKMSEVFHIHNNASCTQVCASQRPSQILDGQCCHINPTVLTSHHHLIM